jgi:tetratricopeptide (TPR) repeat protein
MQRFDTWMKSEITAAHVVRDTYVRVIELKDPQATVVASARFAENAASLRRKLVTSVVPSGGVRGKEAREAYCLALADAAEPLADNAKLAFGACAVKANEFGLYDETVRSCLREADFVEDEVEPALRFALPELDPLRALPAGDAKRTQVAADIIERAETALSKSRDQRPYVVLAMLALETGKPAALANAYMSLAVDDHDPLVLAARAVVAAARGNWAQAGVAADQAVALAPDHVDLVRLSVLVDVHLGRWESAGNRLDRLDNGYDMLVARAIITRASGDPQQAEQLYQRAIQVDGARPEAHFDLGLLYELHTNPRDPGRASDEYKRAGTRESKRRAAALDFPHR